MSRAIKKETLLFESLLDKNKCFRNIKFAVAFEYWVYVNKFGLQGFNFAEVMVTFCRDPSFVFLKTSYFTHKDVLLSNRQAGRKWYLIYVIAITDDWLDMKT